MKHLRKTWFADCYPTHRAILLGVPDRIGNRKRLKVLVRRVSIIGKDRQYWSTTYDARYDVKTGLPLNADQFGHYGLQLDLTSLTPLEKRNEQ
jgi:hypothetical protein